MKALQLYQVAQLTISLSPSAADSLKRKESAHNFEIQERAYSGLAYLALVS